MIEYVRFADLPPVKVNVDTYVKEIMVLLNNADIADAAKLRTAARVFNACVVLCNHTEEGDAAPTAER